MWRQPNRPNHKISESFNDGVISLFSTEDIAIVGRAPVKELTLIYTLHFAEKRVGVTRYYQARQAQVEVDRVVRIQYVPGIHTNIIAKINGKEYRIDQIQAVENVYPKCLDLTLTERVIR